MSRYVCIHGHFYQPPRENPWLEEVEMQEFAYPYHDWNEKITAECYAPNSASRILGHDHRKIVNIVNNYSNISFNFGPTLLSWMENHTESFYRSILDADKESQKKFSGHGSALAQVYNHMIMPLADTKDERTQIYWGIRDFEHRFKRKPEGMWLAETAVNTETLELLAEYGINFTILAPHQAKRVRKIDTDKWTNVKEGNIDPQVAYLCQLPSGKSINLFFYDGPISHELAFQDLLKDGVRFAERIIGTLPEKQNEVRMVHIATDGETYGHHQNFGDMALASCIHHIESKNLAKMTVYGEFLEKYPPVYEVEIIDDTSWSCIHGIERWKSDCGCCSGGNPEWNQKWREPLRNNLDWLRDRIIPMYEQHMSEFTDNPWKVRDNFIDVILDRTSKSVEKFFKSNINKELNHEKKTKVLKLLEIQRHAMVMYTSCGWFFDEISGIETTQILKYAARVIQLSRENFDVDLEKEFVNNLKSIPSNIPEFGNGAMVYERFVKPATIDILRVGAHYAIDSLFKEHEEESRIYCYTAISDVYDLKEVGNQKMAIGRARIRSDITWEDDVISFAALHFGDHNLNGGVRLHMGEDAFKGMYQEIKKAFSKSDIPEVIRLMSHHFGTNNYSLKHLFKDEQKHIFDKIIASTLKDIESHFRQIHGQHYPLMQAQDDMQISLPRALSTSIEFVLNQDLLNLLQKEKISIKMLDRVVDEVNRWSFQIDKPTISFMASKKINILMRRFQENPKNIYTLKLLEAFLRILRPLSLNLDLWRAQNDYFAISKQLSTGKHDGNLKDLPPKWLELFNSLGEYLKVQSD